MPALAQDARLGPRRRFDVTTAVVFAFVVGAFAVELLLIVRLS
jgi:hypothetical protein